MQYVIMMHTLWNKVYTFTLIKFTDQMALTCILFNTHKEITQILIGSHLGADDCKQIRVLRVVHYLHQRLEGQFCVDETLGKVY